MTTTLLTTVDGLINEMQIPWKFGIENAKLVIKYARAANSIWELLVLDEEGFSGVLVPTSDMTETSFLEKLQIKHWSYTDFVISALLFCIKYELLYVPYGQTCFFGLCKDTASLLFDKTALGERVFNVLKSTNLFYFYQENALSGFNFFFDEMIGYSPYYRWNEVGIYRMLDLFHFHFTVSFIEKCIFDCNKQNTLGPLVLALCAFRAKLSLSRASHSESFAIINIFKRQKAFLKKQKYLNNRFFFNLVFEKKSIKHFYGSNIEIQYQQSTSIALILSLALGLGCTAQTVLPKIIPSMQLRAGFPRSQENVLFLRKRVNQTNPLFSFAHEPTKSFNRPRINSYSKNGVVGSILGANTEIPQTSNIEILGRSVEAKNRDKIYEYFIVIIDGIHYFSPYGIYGQYKDLMYDLENLIIPHAQKYFKEQNLPFAYLNNYPKYQLDHVLKQCFRDAFHISEDKAHVVVVPSHINAGRTNNKPEAPFSLFDFRIRGPWIVDNMPSLLELVKTRLFESLLWTRSKILPELTEPALTIIVDKIENGYNYAMTRELLFADAFLDVPGEKNNDSSIRFLLELLLQAR